jgi:hypothetical protein
MGKSRGLIPALSLALAAGLFALAGPAGADWWWNDDEYFGDAYDSEAWETDEWANDEYGAYDQDFDWDLAEDDGDFDDWWDEEITDDWTDYEYAEDDEWFDWV